MKKCLLLILFSFNLFAQEKPISESNNFAYNKYNYGIDILNVGGNLFIEPSGRLWCQPYSTNYVTINNTDANNIKIENKASFPLFNKIIYLNNLRYVATQNGFYVYKNKRLLKKIILANQQESCTNFLVFKNNLYFLMIKENYKSKDIKICRYNGKTSEKLISFSSEKGCRSEIVSINNKLYFWKYDKQKLGLYLIDKEKVIQKKEYSLSSTTESRFVFRDELNFTVISDVSPIKIVKYINGKAQVKKQLNNKDFNTTCHLFENKYLFGKINDFKKIFVIQDVNINEIANVTYPYDLNGAKFSSESNSYYCSNGGSLLRLFPHIKKFPRLFNKSNSSSVFSLVQSVNGSIWTGSYEGNISVIDREKVIESPSSDYRIMNGCIAVDNKILFYSEFHKGSLLFSDEKTFKKVLGNEIFFFGYKSENECYYFGSAGGGLWKVKKNYFKTFSDKEITIINPKNELENFNILTISEDRFNNIWFGSGKGIGIYFPKENKAITWLKSNKTIDFHGTMAIRKDTKNTLWVGSVSGELLYYDLKNHNYTPKNFIRITHPLLNSDKPITFLHQWKDFLILGSKDKVLLFDLKKWYSTKTVNVRYLNSMEINLTSNTEQNTILTDKRDESIWFATSDMVYQWDIKKWLTLPTFKVVPNIIIKKDSLETEFSSDKIINFKPTENSFELQINYQTKDNMPRFINGVLVKKGEKPIFESPNLQTKFTFKNLSAGDYVFLVRVCQQDGSFNVFQYPICIDSFLWQKWWFWLLLSIPFFGTIVYFLQKRNQIEKQKKKLSQLNLSSLSNQFRPHFMLNALNSIGSQMQGKPHAEKVISRLGESINILYGFTQKNEFTLPFSNEWKLVENSIEIQRLLFMPDLNYEVRNNGILPNVYKIPVGLIQIPVENALLHGLRNKTDGNCILAINFDENETNYLITIMDNGVGRKNASRINNFKKNGNGLKTIFEMIAIINQHQKNAIVFEIIDKIEPFGTIVKITLNKNIDYDKIKI